MASETEGKNKGREDVVTDLCSSEGGGGGRGSVKGGKGGKRKGGNEMTSGAKERVGRGGRRGER